MWCGLPLESAYLPDQGEHAGSPTCDPFVVRSPQHGARSGNVHPSALRPGEPSDFRLHRRRSRQLSHTPSRRSSLPPVVSAGVTPRMPGSGFVPVFPVPGFLVASSSGAAAPRVVAGEPAIGHQPVVAGSSEVRAGQALGAVASGGAVSSVLSGAGASVVGSEVGAPAVVSAVAAPEFGALVGALEGGDGGELPGEGVVHPLVSQGPAPLAVGAVQIVGPANVGAPARKCVSVVDKCGWRLLT